MSQMQRPGNIGRRDDHDKFFRGWFAQGFFGGAGVESANVVVNKGKGWMDEDVEYQYNIGMGNSISMTDLASHQSCHALSTAAG